MSTHLGALQSLGAAASMEERGPRWANVVALLVWLSAGTVAFLPFAFDTSPWDAIRLHVPGNQGNWWHFLAGAPFFLAFPMIWLRLRSLFSRYLSTVIGRRILWSLIGVSVGGTILVEAPFLLHLAGTSQWQRFIVLSLGFGIIVASALVFYVCRRQIPPTQACVIGLDTAYLANASLCLVVYAGASGSLWTRSGWLVTLVTFWFMMFELAWLLIQASRRAPHPSSAWVGRH